MTGCVNGCALNNGLGGKPVGMFRATCELLTPLDNPAQAAATIRAFRQDVARVLCAFALLIASSPEILMKVRHVPACAPVR
jgi:hypothetical protein